MFKILSCWVVALTVINPHPLFFHCSKILRVLDFDGDPGALLAI